MLKKKTLELIDKLLEVVDYINISRDDNPVYDSSLRETNPTTEYVITIPETLYRWQIQKIDEILAEFDNIEMKMAIYKGLEIYELESE